MPSPHPSKIPALPSVWDINSEDISHVLVSGGTVLTGQGFFTILQ